MKNFNLRDLDSDYAQIEATLREKKDKATREQVALAQLENGSLTEKLLALDSLGPRETLSPHAYFVLKSLIDQFQGKEGLEDVVQYINYYLSPRKRP